MSSQAHTPDVSVDTGSRTGKNTMQYMIVCACVCVWLPVCVALHWLSTALLSAAGGIHPDTKSHVPLLPWLPIKEAARIYKSMLSLSVIFEEKKGNRVFVYCIFVCARMGLTVQLAVARSSCARWETLSLCTETDTPTIAYQ